MEDGGKGHRPDLIVDDGGDMTLLIHQGKNSQDLFLKYITIPDPSSTDNYDVNIVQTTIKRQLEGGETYKWNKNFSTQDHAVASITYDESAAVFSWNSKILEEYWY